MRKLKEPTKSFPKIKMFSHFTILQLGKNPPIYNYFLDYNFSPKCHFQLQNIFHDFSLQSKKINKNKSSMKHSQAQ